MDTATSLLGNKMFASMYDPNADKLAADYRARAASSLGSLTDTVTKGNQTQDILSKIPGVSADTKASLDSLLAEAKSFTTGAAGSTPNTIAAKKDEVDTKIQDIVKKAQTEAKEKKVAVAEEKTAAVKEKVANQKFSVTRLAGRIWTQFKMYFLYLIIAILALWGGSMSSNAMISTPVYMRFYYFVYGTLLFPIAFIFALMRYTGGGGGAYHAVLAPLIEGPVLNPVMAGLLYPFVYTGASTLVTPLPVSTVTGATALPEAAIMAKAQQNALAATVPAAYAATVPAAYAATVPAAYATMAMPMPMGMPMPMPMAAAAAKVGLIGSGV
jgi:hypothetical protein